VISAIFYAVGALTRSLVAVYTSGIALLAGWSIAGNWTQSLDRDAVTNAVDIFGLMSLELTTRYWTVAERNTQLIPKPPGRGSTRRWTAAAVQSSQQVRKSRCPQTPTMGVSPTVAECAPRKLVGALRRGPPIWLERGSARPARPRCDRAA